MTADTKNGLPFRGSTSNRNAGVTKSELANSLADLRNAYFNALLQVSGTNSPLPLSELLDELRQTTELTAESFHMKFNTVLSPEERKRLQSAGVSKHGFIDVSLEKAREMPDLLPSWLSIEHFEGDRMAFEEVQQLLDTAQRYDRLVDDALLRISDAAYRDALAFYKSVKDAAAAKVPGAEVILEKLSTYFKSHGQHKTDKPTEADVERDVRSLLHGTKEGRVVVENTMPHTVAGTRRVVDHVKGRDESEHSDM